jgi:hypothetical protein
MPRIAGAQRRDDRALRQASGLFQLAELRDARGERRILARNGLGKRGMDIGEMDAGAREMVLGVRDHLVPRFVERRRFAIDPPAPQE